MQISCCLGKFTGITLPQLFQRITGSSSSAHSAVLSQAVEKGITNLNNKPAWDTYPERNENFFLPHGHPNCLPILNTCNQKRRECDLGYDPHGYLQFLPIPRAGHRSPKKDGSAQHIGDIPMPQHNCYFSIYRILYRNTLD